ncbi:MAG: glycosyltransferase, partial [Bacteroidota bacterium]
TLNLIKAYLLCKSRSDFKLVITGKVEAAHEPEVRSFINRNDLKSDIIITKYLPDEALKALFVNAKAFLFPTLYEGFGIPILESMAAGIPVLTSTTGAAPETAGDFAVLVDPLAPESIATGIDQLIGIDTKHLEKAKTFALGHTWSKTAQMTALVYKKYV